MQHSKEERLAKWIAHAGYCSRREAERLIQDGHVKVDGEIVLIPQTPVSDKNVILVNDEKIQHSKIRLWLYHKPKGLVTTHHDPQGRPTVFENLPPSLPHVISVGRLDLNTEGLLLLTNYGPLARQLELPSTSLKRIYHVRIYGVLTDAMIAEMKKGPTIDDFSYAPILAKRLKNENRDNNPRNSWIEMVLSEGKNREIRNVLNYFDLQINRLIRVAYGPFKLGNSEPGQCEEIEEDEIPKLSL